MKELTKIVVATFILNIIFAFSIVNAENKKFIDIENHWAEKSIRQLAEKGVVSGYFDNTFKPENEITIIEFLKMIIEVGEYNLIRSGESIYPDFYLETAISKNLIARSNYENINRSMTRYEMVDIISRFIGTEDIKESKNIFKDLNNESKSAVLKLVKLKIINGYEDKTFRGDNNVTRAEAINVICNILRVRDEIILNRKYDITERKDLSNYASAPYSSEKTSPIKNSSIKTFYEIQNNEILIYDEGRYAKLDGYKLSSEKIKVSKVIKIIKNLINEKAYAAVIYVPSKYTINELKIYYGKNEVKTLCGEYYFAFNYYTSDVYKLATKSLNEKFSNNCFLRIDLIDMYDNGLIDEYKKEKLLSALKIECGNDAIKILKYMLDKNKNYEANIGREQEHIEKKTLGKYIVNYYQKENGIPQFYIERK